MTERFELDFRKQSADKSRFISIIKKATAQFPEIAGAVDAHMVVTERIADQLTPPKPAFAVQILAKMAEFVLSRCPFITVSSELSSAGHLRLQVTRVFHLQSRYALAWETGQVQPARLPSISALELSTHVLMEASATPIPIDVNV